MKNLLSIYPFKGWPPQYKISPPKAFGAKIYPQWQPEKESFDQEIAFHPCVHNMLTFWTSEGRV
jgi:hypothetical protein